MNVFKVSIMPAYAGKPELIILSVAPGVPKELVMQNAEAIYACASRRDSQVVIVKDAVVELQQPSLWQQLKGWLAGRGAGVHA